MIQIEGLPESSRLPKLSLQLSSPVEEASLTELFDPSLEDPPASMKASFRGIETNQATLTLEVLDAAAAAGGVDSNRLGSAEPLDLASTLQCDAMSSKKEYQLEPTIPVYGEEGKEKAVCHVTLRLIFVPSAAEKREKLYELLTVATKKKATVVDKLRKVSMQASNNSSGTQTTPKSPAVKAGFLNNNSNKPKMEEQQQNQWKVWYNTYLGPASFVRRNFSVLKNYIIFFGAVGFFHFQGHVLALPPPV